MKMHLQNLDRAGSLDPASEAIERKQNLYIDWGNDLLERSEFPVAIEKFELAVSQMGDQSGDVARDTLANGHLQWATDLPAAEDFLGAFERLQTAKETAATDDMKKSGDTALDETYPAFSNSTGPQARQTMRDILKTICEDKDVAEMPIFCLDEDSIRFGIYGVEDKLPENLAAKTPGEMHYIACILPENEIVESRKDGCIVGKIVGRFLYERFWQ